MSISIHIATTAPHDLMPVHMIAALMWHWKKAGHQVTSGPRVPGGADLGILHVDRTRVIPPAPILPAPKFGILNGEVTDISKRSFSTLRVDRGDCWDGPVIVKSNLNSFGYPEWRSARKSVPARLRRNLARFFWRSAETLPPWRYPVMPRLADVPAWVWSDPELVVERFMPERAGRLYCLRGWVFFGKRAYTYRLFSRTSVVKVGSITSYEFLDAPPPELEEFRAKHGFDFGKFDYVQVDGRPILLDINKTPTIASIKKNPDTPRMRHLAEGLNDFTGGNG